MATTWDDPAHFRGAGGRHRRDKLPPPDQPGFLGAPVSDTSPDLRPLPPPRPRLRAAPPRLGPWIVPGQEETALLQPRTEPPPERRPSRPPRDRVGPVLTMILLLVGSFAGAFLGVVSTLHVVKAAGPAVTAFLAADTTASAAAREAARYGGSAAGNAALDWAEGHAAGCWYTYGGSSCAQGYDCSGLVMEAFAHGAGISLPHSTYMMLAGDPHLHWIPLADARRGDLLFYGSGHVEIDTVWYHMSFGAHDWGQRVGWVSWSRYWAPTAAYRVY